MSQNNADPWRFLKRIRRAWIFILRGMTSVLVGALSIVADWLERYLSSYGLFGLVGVPLLLYLLVWSVWVIFVGYSHYSVPTDLSNFQPLAIASAILLLLASIGILSALPEEIVDNGGCLLWPLYAVIIPCGLGMLFFVFWGVTGLLFSDAPISFRLVPICILGLYILVLLPNEKLIP